MRDCYNYPHFSLMSTLLFNFETVVNLKAGAYHELETGKNGISRFK